MPINIEDIFLERFYTFVHNQPREKTIDHSTCLTCAMGDFWRDQHPEGSQDLPPKKSSERNRLEDEIFDYWRAYAPLWLDHTLNDFGWCAKNAETYGDLANALETAIESQTGDSS